MTPTRIRAARAALALVLASVGAPGVAAEAARAPAQVYRASCNYCHDAGVSPSLTGRALPVEYVRERVRYGFRAMPAFKPTDLSDAELAALVDWLNAQPPVPPR